MSMIVWAELGRWFLVALLGVAAAGKATRRAEFAASLHVDFDIAPAGARGATVALIVLEAAMAASLAAGGVPARVGAMAATALFLAFGLGLTGLLAAGRNVSCRCFGGDAHEASAADVMRNAVGLAASVLYIVAPPAAQAFTAFDQAVLALGGAVGFFVLLASVELGRPAVARHGDVA